MTTSRHPPTRHESKELTRRALLRSALRLARQNSFARLSLREVSKEAGITPAAFYRHFDDMEELGLVLAEESSQCLAEVLAATRLTREGELSAAGLLAGLRSAMADCLRDRSAEIAFIVRERQGGIRRLRRAVGREIQLFADELAIDLAALPELATWNTDDRRMVATLAVETVLHMAADLLEGGGDEETATVERANCQLQLIALGVSAWPS